MKLKVDDDFIEFDGEKLIFLTIIIFIYASVLMVIVKTANYEHMKLEYELKNNCKVIGEK